MVSRMLEQAGHMTTPTDPGGALRRLAMSVVIMSALVLIFVDAVVVSVLGSVALVVFLVLAHRQFTIGTWVPVLLSALVLVLALWRGVSSEVFLRAADRMIFLSALIAMLGCLRSAASVAPEVRQAGAFVTSQPASHRYLAMTFGGHVFGVLINFGGLALLLDMANRAMASEAAMRLPPEAQEARLKRMVLAVVRGFSMISLWSPFGFATNAILVALPGLSYVEFGPIGLAMSFVYIAVGWLFDRAAGRKFRALGLPRPAPPRGSWVGALLLLGHVFALGGLVFFTHGATQLSFQQALILVVPCYALVWVATVTRREPGGTWGNLRQASTATWQRLSYLGPEVGVFASAGFLPVLLLTVIPTDPLREAVASWGLGAMSLAAFLSLSIVGGAMMGINPIVSSSVLAAVLAQLSVPGLSDAVIALTITGSWTAVISLSPFITTLVICSAIVGRSPARIGLVWNGAYCLTILAVWWVCMAGAMSLGWI